MTISSLPISTSSQLPNDSLSMAVLAKSLDTAETAGQGIIKMMEQSVNPNLGANIDTRI